MAQCKRPLSQFSPRPGERKSQSTTAAILSWKLVDVCALVPLLLVLLWSKYQVVATARISPRQLPEQSAESTSPSGCQNAAKLPRQELHKEECGASAETRHRSATNGATSTIYIKRSTLHLHLSSSAVHQREATKGAAGSFTKFSTDML
jgi:hypothetical protein